MQLTSLSSESSLDLLFLAAASASVGNPAAMAQDPEAPLADFAALCPPNANKLPVDATTGLEATRRSLFGFAESVPQNPLPAEAESPGAEMPQRGALLDGAAGDGVASPRAIGAARAAAAFTSNVPGTWVYGRRRATDDPMCREETHVTGSKTEEVADAESRPTPRLEKSERRESPPDLSSDVEEASEADRDSTQSMRTHGGDTDPLPPLQWPTPALVPQPIDAQHGQPQSDADATVSERDEMPAVARHVERAALQSDAPIASRDSRCAPISTTDVGGNRATVVPKHAATSYGGPTRATASKPAARTSNFRDHEATPVRESTDAAADTPARIPFGPAAPDALPSSATTALAVASDTPREPASVPEREPERRVEDADASLSPIGVQRSFTMPRLKAGGVASVPPRTLADNPLPFRAEGREPDSAGEPERPAQPLGGAPAMPQGRHEIAQLVNRRVLPSVPIAVTVESLEDERRGVSAPVALADRPSVIGAELADVRVTQITEFGQGKPGGLTEPFSADEHRTLPLVSLDRIGSAKLPAPHPALEAANGALSDAGYAHAGVTPVEGSAQPAIPVSAAIGIRHHEVGAPADCQTAESEINQAGCTTPVSGYTEETPVPPDSRSAAALGASHSFGSPAAVYDSPDAAPRAIFAAVSAHEMNVTGREPNGRAKITLSPDDAQVGAPVPRVGIRIADTARMPSARFAPRTLGFELPPPAVSGLFVGEAQLSPVALTPGGAAAADRDVHVSETAHRAVEATLQAIELLAQPGHPALKLDITVGGEHLVVRVKREAGEIHTVFQTDSPDLQAALSQEWHVLIGARAERPMRLADPQFTGLDGMSAGNSSDFGTDGRRRAANHRRDDDEFAIGSAGRAARSSDSAAIAAATQVSGNSLHLHTRV